MKTALAKRLVHDVGKYISRAARNMNDTGSVDVLHELFVEDLYRTDGTERASVLFADIARPLEGVIGKHPGLDCCRGMLSRIDELESAVRAKEEAAVDEAKHRAIAVDDTLRALLSELLAKDDR